MNRACRALLRRRAACGGFTLLEMLIVVAALAATAALAFAAVGNRDDQLRFDLTQQRLQALRSAMIGPAADAGVGLTGFAADNGSLPTSIDELIVPQDPSLLLRQPFGTRAPVFDQTPDPATGLNSLPESEWAVLNGHRLLKGYRGPYVDLAPGSSAFRDGWSNRASDADEDSNNFGWEFIPTSPASLEVISRGRNGRVDLPPLPPDFDPYDVEVTTTIADTDWRTDIAGGLTVRVRGKPSDSSVWYFSVSLLVYENDAGSAFGTPGAERWRRFSTEPIPISSTEPLPSSCGEVRGGIGRLDNTEDCSALTFVFPVGGGYSPGIDTRVPYGRHLLVLVNHNTKLPYLWDAATGRTVAVPVDFHRRSVPATVTIEVPTS